jgi:superfamily II DNA or RNA helicase
MSLRGISLKKAYSSDCDDILRDFYVPALSESLEYSRLAGLFSSTSLAVAARGVLGLIRNDGHIRLIVAPRFTQADAEAILDSYDARRTRTQTVMLAELHALENEFVMDHVRALGWMIANGKLDIRVAIPRDQRGRFLSWEQTMRSGVFHQKVGVLRDAQGSTITFSGSLNETASGWMGNVEEFKVFRGWEPSEAQYVEADVANFERFWSDRSRNVSIMEVPSAVRERLVQIAPSDLDELSLEKWTGRKTDVRAVALFDHQREAVSSWVNSGMRGILEMATGTGKTFAALGCLDKVAGANRSLVTVITCPYQHLIRQWIREIAKFGTKYDTLIIADASNPGWKHALADTLVDVALGHKSTAVVVTTHRTFSSRTMLDIIGQSSGRPPMLLIADEVHGVGAKKARQGLIDAYRFRLGLSATPRRWFDGIGTAAIFDHFGGTVYEFPLERAISTINPATGETYLAPYRYLPLFVSLDEDEMAEYLAKTRAIARRAGTAKSEKEDELARLLLFKRADIVKSAAAKYGVLDTLLDAMGPDMRWTIVYCSPKQIDRVMRAMNARGLTAHRFTMDEGTAPDLRYGGETERDFLLRKFGEGQYQILVAMRCLDEGVDVPPARTAILMASSGNPREHIQRIGRVMRRYPGKHEATIYDILVAPSLERVPPELRRTEWRIFERELARCEEIASTAVNNADALQEVYQVKRRFLEGGV